jgi:hypothetical protein
MRSQSAGVVLFERPQSRSKPAARGDHPEEEGGERRHGREGSQRRPKAPAIVGVSLLRGEGEQVAAGSQARGRGVLRPPRAQGLRAIAARGGAVEPVRRWPDRR